MLAVETRWNFEQYISIVKITATVTMTNVKIIDNVVEKKLISKMVDVIEEAEKFEGRPLDTVPNIPTESGMVVVCSSIIFSSPEKLNAFKENCSKILNQE